MLKHICEDQLGCKKCQRNARLKARYHADPAYRESRQVTARTYKQTTQPTEAAILKNRAAAIARYHRLKDTPEFKIAQKQRDQKRRPKLYRFPALPSRKSKLTTQTYWKMVIGLLAERDGWDCYLCHLPTTWETVSIDHVIPRCLEPDNHAPTNLRIAHRRCNYKRGNSHRN